MTERRHINDLGDLLRDVQPPRRQATTSKPSRKKKAKGREGAASPKQGARLESWIRRFTRNYYPDITLIFVPPHVHTWRDAEGQLRATHTASTWVDFIALMPDLPLCHFEAKSTTQKSWKVDERLDGYQGDLLKARAAQGEIAFVYVRRLQEGKPWEDYIVPCTARGLPLRGQKSMVWSKLRRWKLPPEKTWVDCVRVWEAYSKQGRRALQ